MTGWCCEGVRQSRSNVKNWFLLRRFLKPLFTHAQPLLTETVPRCCLPLAKLLTTEEQLMTATRLSDDARQPDDTEFILRDGSLTEEVPIPQPGQEVAEPHSVQLVVGDNPGFSVRKIHPKYLYFLHQIFIESITFDLEQSTIIHAGCQILYIVEIVNFQPH